MNHYKDNAAPAQAGAAVGCLAPPLPPLLPKGAMGWAAGTAARGCAVRRHCPPDPANGQVKLGA